MGLLDGVLGGLVGGEIASLVNDVIARQGGLSGLVSKLEAGGLGTTVQSWISNGPNAAVSGDQLHNALGSEVMQQLAAKTGLSPEELAQKLSQVLPGVVDKLTPLGVLPSH